MSAHFLGALLLSVSVGVAGAGPDEDVLLGVWRNPRNSVHVELRYCGEAYCGEVIWASDKAKADARRAGTEPLVGVEVLRSFRKTADGRWRGTVFVPDLAKTISGTLILIDPNTFRARSCTLEVFCKTQVWTRIG